MLRIRRRPRMLRNGAFGSSGQNINHRRLSKDEVRDRLEKARAHMEFVAKLYQSQLAHGAHFLHGHPATAA
eukprot:345820-Alexandrium_andersonii.AAC.1